MRDSACERESERDDERERECESESERESASETRESGDRCARERVRAQASEHERESAIALRSVLSVYEFWGLCPLGIGDRRKSYCLYLKADG